MKFLKRQTKRYFIAKPSGWPIIGSCSLFLILIGIINIIHQNWLGHYLLAGGAILFIYLLQGWFGAVIAEDKQGLHSQQMERSYRWGMVWFIASEVAFFGAFFGALFYIRFYAVPLMGTDTITHTHLWPQFTAHWPLLKNPNPTLFPGPSEIINTWGLPALNTLLLLASAATVTWALWGLKQQKRKQLNRGMCLTIVLGALFLMMQAYEYSEAYTHLNLTLASGIYGTTFFVLTGFHALHVMIGLIMLSVIGIRCLKGDFTPAQHFGVEAVAWYWHFVDVIWLFLFVFVYWL